MTTPLPADVNAATAVSATRAVRRVKATLAELRRALVDACAAASASAGNSTALAPSLALCSSAVEALRSGADALSEALRVRRTHLLPLPPADASASLSTAADVAACVCVDPRFAYVEWVLLSLLRPQQVVVVRELQRAAAADDTPIVRQLLMGMGKTSVIAPLLALLLADGSAAFALVAPTHLLRQSALALTAFLGNGVLALPVRTLALDRTLGKSEPPPPPPDPTKPPRTIAAAAPPPLAGGSIWTALVSEEPPSLARMPAAVRRAWRLLRATPIVQRLHPALRALLPAALAADAAQLDKHMAKRAAGILALKLLHLFKADERVRWEEPYEGDDAEGPYAPPLGVDRGLDQCAGELHQRVGQRLPDVFSLPLLRGLVNELSRCVDGDNFGKAATMLLRFFEFFLVRSNGARHCECCEGCVEEGGEEGVRFSCLHGALPLRSRAATAVPAPASRDAPGASSIAACLRSRTVRTAASRTSRAAALPPAPGPLGRRAASPSRRTSLPTLRQTIAATAAACAGPTPRRRRRACAWRAASGRRRRAASPCTGAWGGRARPRA